MKSKTIILGIFFALLLCALFLLLYFLGPSSSESKSVSFVVSDGESLNEIASNLKKEGLIKNIANYH